MKAFYMTPILLATFVTACATSDISSTRNALHPGRVSIAPEPVPDGTVYPHPMSVRIWAPWEQEGQWVMRSPETIGSNHGILFIDHTRPDMLPVTLPVSPLRWEKGRKGELHYQCNLDRGFSFTVRVTPGKDDVTFESAFTNNWTVGSENMGNQYCLIQKGVKGFEDPEGRRTYILVNGQFMAMRDTHPGLQEPGSPFFIITTTRDIPPFGKFPVSRSWAADEQADIPLIATVSEDGKHIVGLAFDNAYKIMTNCEIPCIHADPKFADCPAGETVKVRGKMYFIEGKLEDLLPRFYKDFPEWTGK